MQCSCLHQLFKLNACKQILSLLPCLSYTVITSFPFTILPKLFMIWKYLAFSVLTVTILSSIYSKQNLKFQILPLPNLLFKARSVVSLTMSYHLFPVFWLLNPWLLGLTFSAKHVSPMSSESMIW